MDAIEVSLASAAAERVSTACVADTPNVFIETFMKTAASAISTPDTLANSTAALPAPPSTCLSDIPAFSSSRKASAIPDGATFIVLDKLSAAFSTACSSPSVRPAAAFMPSIASSNFAAVLAAITIGIPRAVPTRDIDVPRACIVEPIALSRPWTRAMACWNRVSLA